MLSAGQSQSLSLSATASVPAQPGQPVSQTERAATVADSRTQTVRRARREAALSLSLARPAVRRVM